MLLMYVLEVNIAYMNDSAAYASRHAKTIMLSKPREENSYY